MEIAQQTKQLFLETLWEYYAAAGRGNLQWRSPEPNGNFDPYKIMVSELMLQQTQVARVLPKYQQFLQLFPAVINLAQADLGDVLRAWQGLGYNRRAKFLWLAAHQVRANGAFPNTMDGLVKLPGIGVNTAGAIMAYAYNQPVVFIETNVRTVYLHHFFRDEQGVADKQIADAVMQTLDHENPREFYWALMDYGSHLKATVGNANRASKHYTKQSKFSGSRRQVRGQVIRLLDAGPQSLPDLAQAIRDERLPEVLAQLMQEGMIRLQNGRYLL